MEMKDHHTIVEKWPLRLKLEPGQPGAEEELKVSLASGHTHVERYVEWARVNELVHTDGSLGFSVPTLGSLCMAM